ncbi:MAG: AraC family transcriptional regulator, partial [Thermoflexibacter sp.]|nr:AraC family transcriptional regulator [Thermoflexibacter sp.]
MNYKEIKPNGFLSNFVQSFWYYETVSTEVQHTILPDGYFDLIAAYVNDTLTTVQLTGVWTKPKDLQIPANTQFFAIRFRLLAIEYLFKREIKSVLDSTLDLPLSYWNFDSYSCKEFEKFATETSSYLNNSIKHLKKIDDRKVNLFDVVYRHKARNVSELSSQICWSSRQINRYFNSKFGISLKEFLKIVRCNASYKEISKGNINPQADDFFDQAHFIKEIKKYTR